MNLIYKLLLTINATSWMGIIYAIKEEWTIGKLPVWSFGLLLLMIPVGLSAVSLLLTKKFGRESLSDCTEISLADGEFLPVYLGYFFVAVTKDTSSIYLYLYYNIFH